MQATHMQCVGTLFKKARFTRSNVDASLQLSKQVKLLRLWALRLGKTAAAF